MTDIKSKLQFPADWHGTLITYAKAGDIAPLIQEVFDKMNLLGTEIIPAHTSASGTYRSWKLSATLPTREDMELLFANLGALPGVKMLL
ncbi:MAG: DUF493 family protein [Victivallales bacterium]|jgi:putative lipoic acid-binding regulatory protein|nr:DUF493 family protein [Victivallales bacterium]MBR4220579.1 DUF493 family protein [Victivallales bacterium]